MGVPAPTFRVCPVSWHLGGGAGRSAQPVACADCASRARERPAGGADGLASRLLSCRRMTTAWALSPVEPSFAERPDRLGSYDVLGPIAEGGMGMVYRGRDRVTGQLVALKTVRSERRA